MFLSKIKNNIYIIYTLIFIITLGVILITVQRQTNDIVSELTLNRARTAKKELVSYLDELEKRALPISELIASRQTIIDNIKNDDYDAIKRILLDYSASIDIISVCDPSGIILCRSYDDSYGEDVSSQQNIAQVLRTGIKSSSITFMPNGILAVYASAPIYDEDTLLGVVNCHFDLTKNDCLDEFKTQTGCEATIFLGSERIATTIKNQNGDRIIGTYADQAVADAILIHKNEYYLDIIDIHGGMYGVHYTPLIADNQTVGMLFTGVNVDATLVRQRNMNTWILVASLFGIIVAAGFGIISNTFARKHARAILELSEKTREADEYSQLLLDATPISCALWDDKYHIINCNEETLKLFKVKDKEDFNNHYFKSLSPEFQLNNENSHDLSIRYIKKAFEDGFFRTEWMHKTSDGTPLPCEVTLVRVKHRDEYLVAAYTRDLTEQKRSREQNDLQLARLKVVVNASKLGLWDMEVVKGDPVNPENDFMWSDEFRHMLGYSNENDFPNILSSWSNLLHPDDKEKTIDAFAKHLLDTSGNTPYNVEYRLLKKNGEYSYYHTAGETIRDKDGNALRVMGALKDITEAKNALIRLEETVKERTAEIQALAHWYRSILDAIPLPITVTDADMNWTFVNTAVEELLGKKREDMYGKPCSNWNSNICNTDTCGIACAKRGLRQTYFTQHDSSYQVDVEILKEEDGNIAGFIEVVQDITKIEAMAVKQAEAEEASKAKSSFLANMSHELRTPMNSIIGFSELALDGEVTPRTKEYLSMIMENSKWLLQLINDILDISKIESGNMSLEHIPFDLHELFTACKTIIEPKTIEKNIDLHFYAEPFIGKKLVGDPMRLRQVLFNLLSNSVKFTSTGAVKLAAVVLNSCDEIVKLRFEVKDTGIGMTKEQIDKIFEPFVQADISTTRKFGGTGLGLSICRSIVELMGSKLVIESEPGSGTKISFDVDLNVTDADENTFKNESNVNDIEKPLFEGEILICEDNQMNQRVIVEHLARVGLNAKIAEDGQKGIESICKRMEKGMKPYDLIFMDIHMPVMDGIEATPKILELGLGTPIIAMTANVMKNDMELYKKIGMTNYLGKPFTSQELWRLLLKYLKPVGLSETPSNKQETADNKLQFQLKSDFVKSNQNTVIRIIGAIQDGDIKTAHRIAHSLKSNAGLLGKTTLQNAAAEVEKSLKNEENNMTDAQMDLLKTELDIVLDEFKPYLTENNGHTEVPSNRLTPDDVRELFEKLEPLINSGSPDCLHYTDQLRQVPGTNKIIEKMEDFYFTAAADDFAVIKKSMEAKQWII